MDHVDASLTGFQSWVFGTHSSGGSRKVGVLNARCKPSALQREARNWKFLPPFMALCQRQGFMAGVCLSLPYLLEVSVSSFTWWVSHLGTFWISRRGNSSVCSFPSGASGKEPACLCRRHKRCRFNPWVGKITWRKAWQPTPVFLPGESHRPGGLQAIRLQRVGHDWSEFASTWLYIWCVHGNRRSLETFL